MGLLNKNKWVIIEKEPKLKMEQKLQMLPVVKFLGHFACNKHSKFCKLRQFKIRVSFWLGAK